MVISPPHIYTRQILPEHLIHARSWSSLCGLCSNEEVQCEGAGSHLLERRFQPCEVGFIFISPHFKDEETKTCTNNMPEVTFNKCWSQDSDSSLFNLEPTLYYLSFE